MAGCLAEEGGVVEVGFSFGGGRPTLIVTRVSLDSRSRGPEFRGIAAAEDGFQRGVDPVIPGFQLGLHVGQQRFVGELHLAAERIAQQFAAELPEERVAPDGEQIVSQTVDIGELGAVHNLDLGVDRSAAQVFFAAPADGVEAFQGKAEGVDALVADRALRVAGMLLDQLPDRQAGHGAFVRRQRRHVFWRARQALAEQHFGNPIAAQDGAGARRARLFGKGGRLAQDPPPGEPFHFVDPAPGLSADPRNPVMRGQGLVQKRMVRVENAQHRTVVLKQIGKELDRLFVHRAAQRHEGREVLIALFVQVIEIMNMQPLAGKLRGQPPKARIALHAPQLADQRVGIGELASRRDRRQLGIGQR